MPAPPRRRSPALAAAALAALACPAAPDPALGRTHLEPVWIETVAPDGRPGHTVPALLNTPPGWAPGDAAVALLSDGPWPGRMRERLVAALLEKGTAVLELDVNAARGFGPESARTGLPPTAAELVPDVRGAAYALRQDAGAGPIVALGRGAGGDAAVLAASLERAAPAASLGAGLAAAASLGPEPPLFSLGGALGGTEWSVQAERLCGVLASVVMPSQARAEADCRRALLGAAAAP